MISITSHKNRLELGRPHHAIYVVGLFPLDFWSEVYTNKSTINHVFKEEIRSCNNEFRQKSVYVPTKHSNPFIRYAVPYKYPILYNFWTNKKITFFIKEMCFLAKLPLSWVWGTENWNAYYFVVHSRESRSSSFSRESFRLIR